MPLLASHFPSMLVPVQSSPFNAAFGTASSVQYTATGEVSIVHTLQAAGGVSWCGEAGVGPSKMQKTQVRVAVVDGRVMFDGFGRKRVQIRTSRKQICSRVAQSVCRVAQAASRFAQAASRFARAASRVAHAASSVVIFGGDVPGPRRLLFLWQWF